MSGQTITRSGHQPRSHPRQWCRRGARAAALSLTLTVGAASTLTAAPAWAAGGYALTATIPVGQDSIGVAVSPDGKHAYVANENVPGSVSVIDTATGHVTATIHRLCNPWGVAVSPSGTHIYVTNTMARGTVSVITRS